MVHMCVGGGGGRAGNGRLKIFTGGPAGGPPRA